MGVGVDWTSPKEDEWLDVSALLADARPRPKRKPRPKARAAHRHGRKSGADLQALCSAAPELAVEQKEEGDGADDSDGEEEEAQMEEAEGEEEVEQQHDDHATTRASNSQKSDSNDDADSDDDSAQSSSSDSSSSSSSSNSSNSSNNNGQHNRRPRDAPATPAAPASSSIAGASSSSSAAAVPPPPAAPAAGSRKRKAPEFITPHTRNANAATLWKSMCRLTPTKAGWQMTCTNPRHNSSGSNGPSKCTKTRAATKLGSDTVVLMLKAWVLQGRAAMSKEEHVQMWDDIEAAAAAGTLPSEEAVESAPYDLWTELEPQAEQPVAKRASKRRRQ